MKRSEIKDRFCRLVAEEVSRNLETITEPMSFREDLAMDSLDEIELVMATEEEFDIEISDEQAESVKTVGEAITAVMENRSDKLMMKIVE